MTYLYFYSIPYFIIHNNSGEQISHSHDIRPTFSIVVRNTNDTIMSYRYLSAFQNLSSAQCVYNSTTYLTIPLDIVLSSDSLYHLGDQVVYLDIYGYSPQNNRWFEYIVKISLRVQAGMDMFIMNTNLHADLIFAKLECEDKSQLYDFTTHECVSECPCGFAPFRLHHTAYCAAGIIIVI